MEPTSPITVFAADLRDLQILSIEAGIGDAGTVRVEDGEQWAHFIYFVPDDDGIWRILGMRHAIDCGLRVRLEKVVGMDQRSVRELEVLQDSLDWEWQKVVVWRQVPRMTLVILEERKKVPPALQYRIAGAEDLGGSGVSDDEVRRFVEGLR